LKNSHYCGVREVTRVGWESPAKGRGRKESGALKAGKLRVGKWEIFRVTGF